MAASRILYPSLSGRDRRHYASQLHKAEQAYEAAKRDAEAAHAAADIALQKAHRLDCEAWSALQFIGGTEDPSPTIADCIQCRHCNHTQAVDLTRSGVASQQAGAHPAVSPLLPTVPGTAPEEAPT